MRGDLLECHAEGFLDRERLAHDQPRPLRAEDALTEGGH